VSNKNPNDLVFGGIKKDSANRWLNRRLHRLGITVKSQTIGNKAIYKKGNHSVRKYAIQEYCQKQYNYYLEQGLLPSEAKAQSEKDACVRLGHGSEGRTDIIKIYLSASS
ncbi:MAG: hypothetical protein IJZ56_00465, partial [Oscillospiraceae bacterium]|nr:hypothetical protein [Oscillospiraceae bacterium]